MKFITTLAIPVIGLGSILAISQSARSAEQPVDSPTAHRLQPIESICGAAHGPLQVSVDLLNGGEELLTGNYLGEIQVQLQVTTPSEDNVQVELALSDGLILREGYLTFDDARDLQTLTLERTSSTPQNLSLRAEAGFEGAEFHVATMRSFGAPQTVEMLGTELFVSPGDDFFDEDFPNEDFIVVDATTQGGE